MWRYLHWLAGSVAVVIVTGAAALFGDGPATRPTTQPTITELKLDLDKAVAVKWPEIKQDLEPCTFETADGRTGWAIRLPGSRPIATPAYADGMIYVGGGYGSHEFYALDAKSGKVAWKVAVADDGPTAAVVEDGYVAFNTESCTLIVLEARTGKLVWQEWLGDPLMSQPAVAKGRVYMAYPGGNPRGVQAGEAKAHVTPPGTVTPSMLSGVPGPNAGPTGGPAPAQANTSPANPGQAAHPERAGHRLLCSDLKTGKHLWEQPITGDVISAPVVHDDQVLFTCFDGTSFCLSAEDGKVIWQKKDGGTSAPLIANGKVVVTRKGEGVGGAVTEGIVRIDEKGKDLDKSLLAAGQAPYLKKGNSSPVALSQSAQKAHDASVGFGTAPAAAGLAAASDNVNISSVVGGWAYQGSRAAYKGGQYMNAQGQYLNAVRSGDGQANWRARAEGKDVAAGQQLFSPPALGKENLYVSTAGGHLLSVRQRDGQPVWSYAFARPIVFQPALAEGNVYFGTNDGTVVCLKTGSADADGWYAWGGNAQHNKGD